MNNLFSAGGRWPNFTAWAIVLLTLAHLCWLQFRPESELNSIQVKMTNPSISLAPYKDCDDLTARSGQGNVFIRLTGCSKANPDAQFSHSFSDYREDFLSTWYFRAAYNLYPRRAFLAPADVVINGGWNMMGIQFIPDPSWFRAHDVRSVLTVGFDDLGRTLPARWEPIQEVKTKIGGD